MECLKSDIPSEIGQLGISILFRNLQRFSLKPFPISKQNPSPNLFK